MTEQLVVYAYNVLFGDAFLIEIPDADTRRFILIDVGNVASGAGGQDQPLLDAIKDIQAITGGRIDLYIMTHEHLDHVQGLLYAKQNGCELNIGTVWMTASAAPDYYANHPDARKKRLELQEAVAAFRATLGGSALALELATLLEINSRATQDCVDYIRHVSQNVHYLYRGAGTEGRHPFAEATLRILAPEEDTSDYFESVAHLDQATGDSAGASGQPLLRPLPLPGIDGGAFYELIGRMENGSAESLFAIDRAANNTSLVVELTWRGRRLLFTGDAEQKSWRKMAQNAGLQPADLLKIGHHGSRNATPPPSILDLILPPSRQNQAVAVLPTRPDVYPGVPDPATLSALASRAGRIYNTITVSPGKPVVVPLQEGG